jgi:uncharacterized membrane protein
MLGLDLHPAVVHFPIALAAVGALAEIIYLLIRKPLFKWLGPILLTLALIGSGVAYFSGTAVEDKAEHQGIPAAAIEAHESSCLWALGAIGLATLLAWATHPRGKGIWIAALVAFVAASLTFWTGHLGGKLVFIHGAGRVAAPAAAGGAPAVGTESGETGETEHRESDH